MLDTRQYDRSITDLYWNTDYVHQISNDAGRSMMGSRQENWFYNSLIHSNNRGAAWRVIGSQTVFSRINESVALGNANPLDYGKSLRKPKTAKEKFCEITGMVRNDTCPCTTLSELLSHVTKLWLPLFTCQFFSSLCQPSSLIMRLTKIRCLGWIPGEPQ